MTPNWSVARWVQIVLTSAGGALVLGVLLLATHPAPALGALLVVAGLAVASVAITALALVGIREFLGTRGSNLVVCSECGLGTTTAAGHCTICGAPLEDERMEGLDGR